MRLLRSLNATHLGRDLERQIEAEFGCRISNLHAKKFRSELESVLKISLNSFIYMNSLGEYL